MIAGLPYSDNLFLFSFHIPSVDDMVSFLLSHDYFPSSYKWEIVDRDTNRLIGRSATYLGV